MRNPFLSFKPGGAWVWLARPASLFNGMHFIELSHTNKKPFHDHMLEEQQFPEMHHKINDLLYIYNARSAPLLVLCYTPKKPTELN